MFVQIDLYEHRMYQRTRRLILFDDRCRPLPPLQAGPASAARCLLLVGMIATKMPYIYSTRLRRKYCKCNGHTGGSWLLALEDGAMFYDSRLGDDSEEQLNTRYRWQARLRAAMLSRGSQPTHHHSSQDSSYASHVNSRPVPILPGLCTHEYPDVAENF